MLVPQVKRRNTLYSYYFFRFFSGSDKSELPWASTGTLESDGERYKALLLSPQELCAHRLQRENYM